MQELEIGAPNAFSVSLFCQFLILSRPLHCIFADLVLQLKSIPQ